MSCQISDGAMYAFPRILFPKNFLDECKIKNLIPDNEYCMRLLENTGIVVVPGSGFGQKQDTWHFRTTFLPDENKIDDIIKKIKSFHLSFLENTTNKI